MHTIHFSLISLTFLEGSVSFRVACTTNKCLLAIGKKYPNLIKLVIDIIPGLP